MTSALNSSPQAQGQHVRVRGDLGLPLSSQVFSVGVVAECRTIASEIKPSVRSSNTSLLETFSPNTTILQKKKEKRRTNQALSSSMPTLFENLDEVCLKATDLPVLEKEDVTISNLRWCRPNTPEWIPLPNEHAQTHIVIPTYGPWQTPLNFLSTSQWLHI